jgi:tetratricopeptide (TPR) repeat protein
MRRTRLLVSGLALATLAPALAAQRSPAEQLNRAIILYEELQLERAVVLFRDVVSPGNAEVTGPDRVRAMKYLGAAFALLGSRDSAIAHFRGAIERDPFTDLEPALFTATERALFAEARRAVFAVGARVQANSGFVPGHGRVSLRFVTTRHARVEAVVKQPRESEPLATFRWSAEGASDSPWDGLDQRGGRLAPGRYHLEVRATSTADSSSDTVALRFDVSYEHEALEDTLAPLDSASLLPERNPPSVARKYLATGLAAAAFAVAVPAIIGNGDLGGTQKHASVMASLSLSGGVVGYLLLQRGSAIPSNIRENARRREERVRHNIDIRQRNEARLAEARMIITPVSGDVR